jgi:hypothetical protein
VRQRYGNDLNERKNCNASFIVLNLRSFLKLNRFIFDASFINKKFGSFCRFDISSKEKTKFIA